MAIFNEAYVELLLEKKTTEEYHKDRFKERYHYIPDEDSKDGTRGTITVDGKKYKVDISSKKEIEQKDKDGNPIKVKAKTSTHAESDADSTIYLDNRFFKLKGSHGNERMDAVLKHEIGHQNLHNSDTDNKTVDPKNRSSKVFRRGLDAQIDNTLNTTSSMSNANVRDTAKKLFRNNLSGRMENIINHAPIDMVKELIYRKYGEDKYLKDTSKEDQERRDSDFNKAAKFAKANNSHTIPEEYEADRFAANRSSERAVKKALANTNKISKKSSSDKQNKDAREDYIQRSKALKDDDLRKAKTYK